MFKKVSATLIAVVLTLSMMACSGPLGKLDSLLPYTPQVIDALVNAGQLNQFTGEVLKSDFADGQAAVTKAKTRLAAGESKAVVYTDLANDWRQIVARNHFAAAGSAKVNTIVGLITTIVGILVRKETQPAGVRGTADLDRQLKLNIDKLEKEVKSN